MTLVKKILLAKMKLIIRKMLRKLLLTRGKLLRREMLRKQVQSICVFLFALFFYCRLSMV